MPDYRQDFYDLSSNSQYPAPHFDNEIGSNDKPELFLCTGNGDQSHNCSDSTNMHTDNDCMTVVLGLEDSSLQNSSQKLPLLVPGDSFNQYVQDLIAENPSRKT